MNVLIRLLLQGHTLHIIHSYFTILATTTTHLNFVPVSIVEVATNCNNLSPAAQVIPQSQSAINQLKLKKVVRAPVICVQQQTVRLVRLEL